MTPFKIRVRDRFDGASASYDGVGEVQKASAAYLVERLVAWDRHFYPRTILDLGTGTGYLPEQLMPHYAEAAYLLNDIAPRMIERARQRFASHGRFDVCVGDMETMPFADYDLITSNLALQWVQDLFGTLDKFYRKSRVFAFSCLLEGTFQEWRALLEEEGLTSVMGGYPKESLLADFCHRLSGGTPFLQAKDFKLQFQNVRCFLDYLRRLGAHTGHQSIPPQRLKALWRDHDKPFQITYRVFFGILRSEKKG